MASDQKIVVEAEVSSFAKNARDSIVGRLTLVYGVPCADVRTFAVNSVGQTVPTKAGLTLQRDQLLMLGALVDKLIAAAGVKAGRAADEDDGFEDFGA